MGKWDKHVASLPRYVDPDVSYRERLDFLKKTILEKTATCPEDTPSLESILETFRAAMADAKIRLLFATRGHKYASSFAMGVRDARFLKAALEEHLKLVNDFIESYTALFIDQIEVEGSSSIKLGDGSNIRIQYEPYAAVEDRDVFREWCKEHGYDREFSMPWMTMNAMVKQHLENNEPEPPGLKLFNKPKLVFSKGR